MEEPGEPAAEALARLLYERHGVALDSWARRRFRDRRVAEEVVHEAVLSAWRKYEQYDPERGSEQAWMFGIVRNVANSRHRKDRRHLQVIPDSEATAGEPEEDQSARIVERSLIIDAMRTLSPDHQAVIAATYWDGLSTREAAHRLGIPEGTVKSRLHYGLRMLRTLLEERKVLR